MILHKKSIHDLRAIAQGFGVEDIFSKDAMQLAQAIELKQHGMIQSSPQEIPQPVYDARLMTKPPARIGVRKEIEDVLQEHINRGLHLSFPEPEIWEMQHGKKSDTGSMRMPLRTILQCADKIMKAEKEHREYRKENLFIKK